VPYSELSCSIFSLLTMPGTRSKVRQEGPHERRQCIFCKGAPTTLYKEENGYRAVACSGCGLVFVTPRPSIDEMKKLYEAQETKIDLSSHLRDRDFKCIQARRCLRFIQRHVPKGRLLEVGSAAGYFLLEARKMGFDVQGMDLTRQFVTFCENALGIPAFEGVLRDAPFEERSFDVVYLRNVLSHLAYPLDEFGILHRLLKPVGFVILETGNVAELPASRAGALELPDHLYHFSERTIAMLLDRTGFDLVRVERFTLLSALGPVRWLGRSFAKEEKPPAARAEAVVPSTLPESRLKKRVAAHVAQFARYDLGCVLPKKGRRATLIVVGRKRPDRAPAQLAPITRS
jgi:SAM-dependent methyltransferase